ncbi:hypothetical protein [Psychromonas antarctica]|uniref:hypothetical protein n=1 Tax=Psychromonas antarctica TaxID=67573 RepID=UPI001EE917B3|nr:hypothetical protein [Psychromonas antarctica]MCG6202851.1 hypothetical protein [Psychromonas antarctica]
MSALFSIFCQCCITCFLLASSALGSFGADVVIGFALETLVPVAKTIGLADLLLPTVR